jgi:splicing factor 3A subunit 3
LYSKQTVYSAHLTSKKHLKASAKLTDSPSDSPSTPTATTAAPTATSLAELRHRKNRALALKEALISSLISGPTAPLSSILADTLSNTERRAALTDRERATEIEELEAREAAEASAAAATAISAGKASRGEIEADEDDDGRIYNPLKLPMGWDGKPIPFWLYKLHGLGVEYTCEICSDTVYMGR